MKNLNVGAIVLLAVLSFSSASCQKGGLLRDSLTAINTSVMASGTRYPVTILVVMTPVYWSSTGQVATTGSNGGAGARQYKVSETVQIRALINGQLLPYTATHSYNVDEAIRVFGIGGGQFTMPASVERVGGIFDPVLGVWRGGEPIFHIGR